MQKSYELGAALGDIIGVAQKKCFNKNRRKCKCGYFNKSKLSIYDINILNINPKAVATFVINKY